MYNCKNIFDLDSYHYQHVRQAVKALIHDIMAIKSIISCLNPKIIHLNYNNKTLVLMKKLGLISKNQSLASLKYAIGNYLFIRLIFAINIMKHIPKDYLPIFKKFYPNQRIRFAKLNHSLKMINIGNHFSGLAEGAVKSGFKSVALIHNNQNEVYNYIFNNPQTNLHQNTKISLVTNNLYEYNYITNINFLNKYHPKAFILKLGNNQDGFNLATRFKNQFTINHKYSVDFHLFNSKYFNTFQNGMYLLLIGIQRSYQISAKNIINRVLSKHLHTSLPLINIFYQIPYSNNYTNDNNLLFKNNNTKINKIPINCSKRINSHLYYRPNYKKPLPRTKLNQFIISPNQKRILNIRELATIQSYPVNYRFLSDNLSSHEEIINNLPPAISEAITNEIAKVITSNNPSKNGLKQKETISS